MEFGGGNEVISIVDKPVGLTTFWGVNTGGGMVTVVRMLVGADTKTF